MEALAAIGLVANILQLIECGHKATIIAKELLKSGKETTQSNANAAFVAQEMRELSLRVTTGLPASGLTDDERALCNLAQQCIQISNEFLLLLEALKVKSPGRKIDVVRASLRNMRRRAQRDQLQERLDNCRKQLNIQISVISRSDLIRKVEDTLNSTSMSRQDILSLKHDVRYLQQKLTFDSTNMMSFFQKLQETFEVPLRQMAILQSLRYPRMHDRFEKVETAHQKTFEWLLDYPKASQNDKNEECAASDNQQYSQAKYHTHREFVTWLQGEVECQLGEATSQDTNLDCPRKGSIFYVAGKPGAGKSTLMKFICEHETTREYLRKWEPEKRLICAKGFFWRLGDDEQKSEAGLLNCLLHQILTAAPELIPIAFPSAWKSDCQEPNVFDPTGRQAFNLLLQDGRVFKKYKTVFFIDGLDEFEGRPTHLIREIISWTRRSASGLKICVSSRQWNEFELGFKGCPNLRVQQWTRNDIETFVIDQFDEISKLSTSVDKQDLNTLAGTIIDKAEGVFLWVRVVLAAIEQGMFNGDDFQDLQEKVIHFPAELKHLYQHLLESIPETDRQNAFTALDFTSSIERPRTLLRYKFLGDFAKDPAFAEKLSLEPITEENLKSYLINTRRQINGRCRGFLEICPAEKEHYKGDEEVSFMHSTAAEFLCQPKVREFIKPYLGDTNILDRICQTFIAFAKSIDTDEFYGETGSGTGDIFPFITQLDEIYGHYILTTPPSSVTSRFFIFLDTMERIIVQRYHKRLGDKKNVTIDFLLTYKLIAHVSSILSLEAEIPVTELIRTLAAKNLLLEYFDKDGRCDLRAFYTDSRSAEQIASAIISGFSTFEFNSRAFRMLEMLFKAGISPNVRVGALGADKAGHQYNVWGWIISRLVLVGRPLEKLHAPQVRAPVEHDFQLGFRYRLIELCLRHGAKDDFSLVFGPCYEVIGANQLLVRVREGDHNYQRMYRMGLSVNLYVDYRLGIVRYAAEKGGILTFRDLLPYCFPNNYLHLYELLDNEPSVSRTNNEVVEFSNPNPVRMPILFPEENRYEHVDDDDGVFARGGRSDYIRKDAVKQCCVHSKKCYSDFEAKIKERGLGQTYTSRFEPIYDDDKD